MSDKVVFNIAEALQHIGLSVETVGAKCLAAPLHTFQGSDIVFRLQEIIQRAADAPSADMQHRTDVLDQLRAMHAVVSMIARMELLQAQAAEKYAANQAQTDARAQLEPPVKLKEETPPAPLKEETPPAPLKEETPPASVVINNASPPGETTINGGIGDDIH